jgi:hypothetical protein
MGMFPTNTVASRFSGSSGFGYGGRWTTALGCGSSLSSLNLPLCCSERSVVRDWEGVCFFPRFSKNDDSDIVVL